MKTYKELTMFFDEQNVILKTENDVIVLHMTESDDSKEFDLYLSVSEAKELCRELLKFIEE